MNIKQAYLPEILEPTKMLSKAAQNLTGQPMFDMLAKAQQKERAGNNLIHLELGDPDFSAPQHVIEATYQAMLSGMTHYVDSKGLPEFRQSIRENLVKSFGLELDYNQVIVTPGANSGIYWVIRCLANVGDEIIIPDPGFATFKAAANAACVIARPYSLDQKNKFRPDFDQIEKLINNKTKLFILNSPSNPTGASIPEEDLERIYQLAEKYDFHVLSDDTYRRMTFESPFAPSITDHDNCRSRTILLSGLSKEYSMSGFRLGYLAGPHKLMEKVALYVETVASCVPPFLQLGGVAALEGDQSIRLKQLDIVRQRRDLLVNKLNAIKGVDCLKPDGGLYLFPCIKGTGFNGDQFANLLLEEAGIVCVSGSAFGQNGDNHIRLSLNKDIALSETIVDKIASVLD
ncbi:pyridoxal phosphate-dependent aminotransferase [Neptuniibacter sp. QD48_55]|uniref:pyridoxal phosphate-dependent aminotransferase n=1 Tax=Neptuniibacter sp. QD48_55 TaxID=3398212 RepID=UPI0039F566C8